MVFAETLRALAAPRRALPIAAVIGTLVAVQVSYGTPRTAVVPLAMGGAFVALAPWSWRVLLANLAATPVRVLAYAASAAAVVAGSGIGLPRALALGPTFLTDDGSLLVATTLYLVGGWGLGRDIELALDLEQVRLKAIRTHLDPHFLYNTLNAIAEWCREDAAVAEDAVLRLATLLRTTLEGLEQQRWPLERELAVVADLFALHHVRDREAFTLDVDVAPSARAISVPPLVLLALAENALKHGPRAGHRGHITLAVTHTDDRVRCVLDNPGPFAPRAAGRGLATLRSRLRVGYGRRATLTLAASAPDRTRAVVELPAS